jgi:hypothetical protein
MSSNAVKLYLWLHLKAYFSGPNRGWVEASYGDIASGNGWDSKTLQRAVKELGRKPYIEIQRATNQYELTRIKILKFGIGDRNSAVDKSVHSNPAAVDVGVDSGVDKSDRSAVHSNPFMCLTPRDLQAPKNAVEEKKEEGTDGVRRRFDVPIAYSERFTRFRDQFHSATGRYPKAKFHGLAFIDACHKHGDQAVLDAIGMFVEDKPEKVSRGAWAVKNFFEDLDELVGLKQAKSNPPPRKPAPGIPLIEDLGR